MSEIGRKKINQKLYKREFYKNEKSLKPEDLLGALNYTLKAKNK